MPNRAEKTHRAGPGACRLTTASGVLAAAIGLFLVGCGMGVGEPGSASASSLSTSGLPRCDASLLHPRITVGITGVLPGKQIVYVDGVMACVDDTARVDALVSQIEGRVVPPQTLPASPTLIPAEETRRR